MKPPELAPFYEALGKYPAVLTEAFEAALQELTELSDVSQRVRWADEGIRVAQQTARGWEASAEYFRASPQVLQVLNFTQFLR